MTAEQASETVQTHAPGIDFDLEGRSAKACIERMDTYGVKARNMATSAALHIKKAHDALALHEYGRWLRKHDIAPRTASRLLFELDNPGKRDQRLSEAKERSRSWRKTQAERRSAANQSSHTYGRSATHAHPRNKDDGSQQLAREIIEHVNNAGPDERARIHRLIFGSTST